MTFSYSGDPSDSDVDEVRFYLGDTDSADPLMTDDEIQFLIDSLVPAIYENNLGAAARAAEILSARFAREVTLNADGVSVAVEQLSGKFQQLAKDLFHRYERQTGVGGGPDVGGITLNEQPDLSVKPMSFGKGQHDNIRAGNQEYGGSLPPEYPYDPNFLGWY